MAGDITAGGTGPGGVPGAGNVVEIAPWRARRRLSRDVPMGAPPFVLEEPCPGCGAERVATMVWRSQADGDRAVPLPRMDPHFECDGTAVLYQDITDSPLPISFWSRILGRFREESAV